MAAMSTFRDRIPPASRPTILRETRRFTEEPHSYPHSPSPTFNIFRGRRHPRPLPSPSHWGTGDLIAVYSTSASPQHTNGTAPGPTEPQVDDSQRKWTQDDQDQYDEQARKAAMNELVASWMDRLQLISVITTFFAAIEAQLIGVTTPDNRDEDPPTDQAANAALAGALVVHVFAAIMSFFAAFFLVRYKLTMAKREERKVEQHFRAADGQSQTVSSSSVWSSNPHVEQVGPFRRGTPPTHLLDHCHSVCMWLSAIGFVLALVGVMCFVWSRLSTSAGIFASVCMGACLISSVGAVFWPASSMHKRVKSVL